MSEWGIQALRGDKTSPGTAVKDFSIDTRYNTLKIALEGTGTVTLTGGSVSQVDTQVTHSLGYKPFFTVKVEHPDNSRWSMAPFKYTSTWELNCGVNHQDSDTIEIQIYDSVSSFPVVDTDVSYKYVIYIDPRKDAWFE